MKIILSRKGFDSQYGGYPSPILPDGRLISLPIPNPNDTLFYSQLIVDAHKTYYDLMVELGIRPLYKRVPCPTCHLDPDIYRGIMPRSSNWKPLFGQINSAARHLEKQGVGVGDLFLFFGWFKQTEYKNKKIAFVQDSPDLHVIFGYMQVGEIIKVESHSHLDEWMQYHPHVRSEQRKRNRTNTLYVARDRLCFNQSLPGASPFNFSKRAVLTKDGFSRSRWDLDPEIFQSAIISYHPEPWKEGYFQSAGRGQEFVIKENSKIEKWAKDLITTNYTS